MKIISQHFLPCSIKYWLLRNEAQTLRRHSYLSSTSVYTRLVFRKDDKKNCQWRCDSRLMSTYTNTERLSLRSIFFSCFSTVLTQNAVLTFTSLLRLLSKTIIVNVTLIAGGLRKAEWKMNWVCLFRLPLIHCIQSVNVYRTFWDWVFLRLNATESETQDRSFSRFFFVHRFCSNVKYFEHKRHN